MLLWKTNYEPLRASGTISTKLKYEGGTQLCTSPVLVSHRCYIPERKKCIRRKAWVDNTTTVHPLSCFAGWRERVANVEVQYGKTY